MAAALQLGDRERFHTDGMVVIRGLIPPDLVGRVRDAVDEMLPAPAARGRVVNAWRRYEAVKELATAAPVRNALGDLYGRRPFAFQTLNFAVGTEQPLHADSVHFDSVPHGWMCGVWVALEDVGPLDGPVVFVRGSHRDEAMSAVAAVDYQRYERDVARALGDRVAEPFHAAPGDVLVWAADLLHGGAAVADPASTRRSQVTHYFFDGLTYVTPLGMDPRTGAVRLRAPLVDIGTGERVVHLADGSPARMVHVRGGRTMLLGPDDAEPGRVTSAMSRARGRHRAARSRVASLRARWAPSARTAGRR